MNLLIDFFLTILAIALFWTVVIGLGMYIVLTTIVFRYWWTNEGEK